MFSFSLLASDETFSIYLLHPFLSSMQYIDMISFQHWYLAQAVLITRSGSGKQQNRTAGQAAASAAVDSEMDERSHRSSYRSSNSACGFM